jgi:TonB family protein
VQAALIVLMALLAQNEGAPSLTKLPKLVKYVEAPYPEAALAENRQGVVVLQLDVTATGTVAAVRVANSSGWEDFDRAALEAAQQFLFEPAEAGELGPVPVRITYRYGFVLKQETKTATVAPAPPPGVEPKKPINFSGTIKEAGTRDPVPFAVVMIAGTSTEADKLGRFAFRGIEPGEHQVEVRAPFFKKFLATEEIRPNEALEVLYHVPRAARDPYEVVVRAKLPKREVARRTLLFEEIERIPGTQGDAIRVVQNLPGVARTPFGIGLLVVRGAPPQDTGVFLDGHRLPILFHFGGIGGLTSVINSRMLARIDFLPGGFGPEQGRVSAGAVYLTSRFAETDRVHGEAVVDIAGASVFVEGPLTKDENDGAFVLALRRSYVDGVLAGVISLTDSSVAIAPRYYDYQVRYDKPLGSKERMLTLLAYGSDDELIFLGDNGGASPQGTESRTFFHRFNPRFTYQPEEGTRVVISPIAGYDFSNTTTSGDPSGNNIRFKIEDATLGIRIDAETPLFSWARLRAGGDLLWFRFVADSELPVFPDVRDFPSPLPTDAPTRRDTATIPAIVSSLYAELQITPFEGLDLFPGLRLDLYDFQADEQPLIDPRLVEGRTLVGFDPRLTARWQIVDPFAIKAQIGRYGQAPFPQEFYINADLPLLDATQASGGFEWEIIDRLSIDVQGFYRYQRNVPTFTNRTEVVDGELRPVGFEPDAFTRGYGMEVLLKLEKRWGLFGWIAYTLSRSEFREEDEDWMTNFFFDQTHNVNFVLSYELPWGFYASTRFRFVTGGGLPRTEARWYDSDSDDYDRETSDELRRAPPFHQLDLRIDKRFTFETWYLEIYLDVQNVYNRKNTEIYAPTFDFKDEVAIPSLPIFPLFGMKGVF